MLVLLITIVALLLATQRIGLDSLKELADWKAGGGLLAAALCALFGEFAILRAHLLRCIPTVTRTRLAVLAIRWIGINALAAAACGCVLALLLMSPLLDQLKVVPVIVVATLAEFVGVALIAGVIWHLEFTARFVTGRALTQSALRFAQLNGISAVIALIVSFSWFTGYDWVADRRHAASLTHVAPVSPKGLGAIPCPDAKAVVVARFDRSLPRDPEELSKFLWRTFSNKPAEQNFSSCTTENWQSRFWYFASALVGRARALGLDSDGLERCLKSLFPAGSSPAYLPVGAYQANQQHTLVWIIVVKWEGTSEQGYLPLSHIRVFAFDAETGRQIGYVSCT